MRDHLSLRTLLAVGASLTTLSLAAPVFADEAAAPAANDSSNVVQTLVVTAQRKEEAIQDVPVAVSAFSADSLAKQQIQGGPDLLRAIPNVTSAKGQYGGFNFQIRGIGTKTVGTSADSGISVHENDIPLTSNNLGDADFFDVERVEVSRGPQGTLFGKNATGGVVNVISNKPTDRYASELTIEAGNYNENKVKGYVNIPLTDTFSVRAAGTYLKRDGFNTNDYLGTKEDGRDLWSGRLTAQWKPTERFHTYLMIEHFDENDDRARTGKTLCQHNPGLTSIGGVPTNSVTQGLTSTGCSNTDSLYSASNFGAPNTIPLLTGLIGVLSGLSEQDMNANTTQSSDLRHYSSWTSPKYQSRSDLIDFNATYDLTDHLQVTEEASYNQQKFFTRDDFFHTVPTGTFSPAVNLPAISPLVYAPVTAGSIADPQVGTTNTLRQLDYYLEHSRELTQEMRIASSFSGPLNFSAGANYTEFNTVSDYYVLANVFNFFSEANNLQAPGTITTDIGSPPNDTGTNYYDNRSTFRDRSYSVFGEAYYQISPTLKATLGLRGNEDRKFDIPLRTLLTNTSSNCGVTCIPVTAAWQELTGRANLEWSPQLSFTDKTIVYGTYSRGYKPGGVNPGTVAGSGVPRTFDPEFVNAFEVGTKNALVGGSVILNLTGFYYDYQGYQISAIVHQTSVNSNINAKIYGAELESLWEPVKNLRFNAVIGYLHTEITSGSQIDPGNITAGDPTLMTLKSGADASSCSAKVSDVAALQGLINLADSSPTTAQGQFLQAAAAGIVGGAPSATNPGGNNAAMTCQGLTALTGAAAAPATAAKLSGLLSAVGLPQISLYGAQAGVAQNLSGNQLPNSPELTVSLGAQYVFKIGESWRMTPRIDYYYQDTSYTRIFNTLHDQLNSWDVTNLSLTVENRGLGLSAQAFVKNVFDKTYIQDSYLQDASVGGYTNVFLGDPRTYGVSVTKKF